MAEVQTVKNLDTVKLISYLLRRTYGQQIADVWDVGLNLALRISDLLSIKFENIEHDRVLLVEGKTSKLATIKLNEKARRLVSIWERTRCVKPEVIIFTKTPTTLLG